MSPGLMYSHEPTSASQFIDCVTADLMQNVKTGGSVQSRLAGGRCRFPPIASSGEGNSADTSRLLNSMREKSY